MLSAVKWKYQVYKGSDNSGNEKKDLCGQSPLADTEILKKLRKRLISYEISHFGGPSGEIRTPGILNPNRVIIFFLTFLAPFSGLYSERSCFPELFAPLFPSVRILSMVKNVVKSKHSPKGIAYRGVLSSSEVSWLYLGGADKSSPFCVQNCAAINKERGVKKNFDFR